ncbi:MAG: class I SAM-dependent methyltransferase [Anaerolineae bacterium]
MLSLSKQERLRQRYKANHPGYHTSLEIYTEWMASLVHEDTRLLDAGCGPGGLVRQHVGVARQVVGVDRYAAHFQEPAEIDALVESDLDRLPFLDASFDLVTCSWVLEHLRAPERVFAEIARVLAPGGRFLFITPNRNNYVVWLRRILPNALGRRATRAIYARNEDFINPTYYRANTFAQIDRMLRGTGLRGERVAHVGDPTYLAFNEAMFRASLVAERLIDRFAPSTRVHLVGLYRKD